MMESKLDAVLDRAGLACRGLACLTAAAAVLFPYL